MTKEEQWILKEKYNGYEDDIHSKAFQADCERLKAGEPLAYIIGNIAFLDSTIHLDSKPLIPRTETEYWVEKAIKEIKLFFHKLGGSTPKLRILDLCAGSGAIGVAVAKAIPEAKVIFGEIDPTHLPTIQKNIVTNLSINRKVLEDQYEVIKSDLFEKIEGTFDFILTNPPYIDRQANTVEQSVVSHEPHLALFGGTQGIELIEKIIKDARSHLNPHGQLWIEHEPAHVEHMELCALRNGFTSTSHKDQYNVLRYSILVLQ